MSPSPQNNDQNVNFEKTIFKLANFSYKFDPSAMANGDLDAGLSEHLILQTLASIDQEWYSLENIIENIKALFGLSFETVEVQDSIDKLRKSSKINYRRPHNKEPELYRIHDRVRLRINNETESKKDLKLRVIQEWFNQLRLM